MPAKRLRTATHCANGHPWADGNAYYSSYNGQLQCRACKAEHFHRWYVRHGVRRGEYKPRKWDGANGAR